jgi:dTDP-4-amino-4,6-dideoxygalactose transaminase
MRIGRTIPPAASPIYPRDIISGIKGLVCGQQELERFRSELKEYFSVKHCYLVSSGKAALTLILQALKDLHPDRDEVLIPAFTCYSVPSSIVRAGLKIKLCDIDPETLDFNFKQLKEILETRNLKSAIRNPQSAIRNRLLAIIPAHLFGLPSDITRVRALVNDPEVTIIEDSAQTMGGEWDGKKLGTLGDVSFFSLGRGKALSTVEGGIILTNREDIAEKIKVRLQSVPAYSIIDLIKLFFKIISLTIFLHPVLFWIPKSIPFLKLGETIYDPEFEIKKMSLFQAGLARDWKNKLKKFKKTRALRSKQWSTLIRNLKNFELSANNYELPKLSALSYQLPHLSATSYELNGNSKTQRTQAAQATQATQFPDLIRLPVRVDDQSLRNKILRQSEQNGLGIMPTYPDSIDGIQELKNEFKGQDFPKAKEVAHNLITFPIHPFVTEKDIAKITALLSQLTHYQLSA